MNRPERKSFSRREFLRAAAVGTGAGLVGLESLTTTACRTGVSRKAIPVGVQLYSVREAAARDLPTVLEAIGKMGYKGVEFAGYYGWDRKPKELRQLLDGNGLKCCGTHTDLETVIGDNLKATAELHAILGNSFLIVPSLEAKDAQGWLDLAKRFNEIAAKAKALGMRVGYHAHAGDFRKLGDTTSWEIFFDNTSPDVIMQNDIGNCMIGGGDPVAILKKYPGRSASVHLKEFGGPEAAVIGQGVVPWAEVFKVCETTGGAAWYVVEHEVGDDPMGSIRGCLEGLRKMGRGLA
ncbi:MAG: sugar phosphate isomerase/epimerase [Acidobacteria bacterium]|nr:sugar phosphate isomerase/epimerase [Acidobacteriota bacterium]MBE3130626.1 sugar phosphate isomerase/epimerase [Acidobacteriota bacterium]